MNISEKVILFGCGGHSRSVADILLAKEPSLILVFVDPKAVPNETIYGFEVVREIRLDHNPYFFCSGNNYAREAAYYDIGDGNLITIISSSAHLGRESQIGKGSFIGNFCHIGPLTTIRPNTIINNGAIVEHEVSIGSHSHIGPRAVVSGRTSIKDRVFIGVGAVIKDFISICSDVIVGAGATVVDNISEPGVYVGCPAKKIRSIEPGNASIAAPTILA